MRKWLFHVFACRLRADAGTRAAGRVGNAWRAPESRRGRGKAPATLNILEQIWDTFGKIKIWRKKWCPKYFLLCLWMGYLAWFWSQKSTSTRVDEEISGRRTKIKIARAVELRSFKCLVFSQATNLLLHLSTGFMGVTRGYRWLLGGYFFLYQCSFLAATFRYRLTYP